MNEILENNELSIAGRIAKLYVDNLRRVHADLAAGKTVAEALHWSPMMKLKLAEIIPDGASLKSWSRDHRTKPRAGQVRSIAHMFIKTELQKNIELYKTLEKVRSTQAAVNKAKGVGK